MAKNTQPIAKRCKALGISPAVTMEMSPYDLTKARITWRSK